MKRYIYTFSAITYILILLFINISFSRYTKNIESENITINSKSFTELTATLTEVDVNNNIYSLKIINNNPYKIEYKVKDEEDKLNIIYGDGSNSYGLIDANTTSTIQITISGKDNIAYEDLINNNGAMWLERDLDIETISPYNYVQDLSTDTMIYLKQTVINSIIASADTIEYLEEGETFSGITSEYEAALLAKVENSDGTTVYFYRGNVTNNYFDFAGYTWRVMRINSDGSIKMILDSSIGSSSYAGSNIPSEYSITSAVEHIDWHSSNVYTQLTNWYNSNLLNTSYEEYITPTRFVFDTTYNSSSSSSAGAVYYFGPYLRAGKDSGAYQPSFSEIPVIRGTEGGEVIIYEENIGLINADEIVFAGGFWEVQNTNFYLYNATIGDSWTMSPSFWDNGSHYKVGMMILGTSKSVHDWPDSTNTLTESLAIRPVISVRGDIEITGTGIASDPYVFVEE